MIYPRGSILLLLAAAFLVSGNLPRLPAEDAVHVVAKGETVYSISRSYRISPEELMRYNGIADASKLQAGARLNIPVPENRAAPKAVSQTPFAEYRVVPHDTLYSIARRHGVTLQALRELNGFSKTHVIKAGERIKIPNGSAWVQPAAQSLVPALDQAVRWPVRPREIAYMTGKLYGVMLAADRQEPVKSLTQGKVVSAGPWRGFGRVAIVQTTGGYLYVYGGCESLSVKEGDRIGPGMEVGKLGIDALSGKPQLFFMVFHNNSPIDPAKAPRA